MKIQNDRINNLNRLLALQKQSMSDLYTEIGSLFVLTDNLSSAFAKAITKLKDLVFRSAELNLLHTGLEQLLQGKLSHFLISHENLSQALNNLRTFLLDEHSNLKIAFEDLHYYYMHGHFSFARHDNLLVIIVNVPLTLQEMTTLIQFQIVKIPLVAPDASGYYSQLVTDFDGVAYHSDARYYLTFDRIQDIPENGQIDLRKANVRLL